MTTQKRPQTPLNLSGRAHAAIRDMIRRSELKGGAVIGEPGLCQRLGLSRTPLREALQRLEGEGLVVKTANRSFVVRKVELDEYLHSLDVRMLLELEAARLATGRIPPAEIRAAREEIRRLMAAPTFDREAHWQSDSRVHGLMARNCGNPVLRRHIERLRVATNLYEIERVAERVEPDTSEHMALLDALEGADADRVAAALRTHIDSLKVTVAPPPKGALPTRDGAVPRRAAPSP